MYVWLNFRMGLDDALFSWDLINIFHEKIMKTELINLIYFVQINQYL